VDKIITKVDRVSTIEEAIKLQELDVDIIGISPEMLNVVTKLYIFKYSSIIKGKNVNIS
jgi:hypothetical protein